MDILLSGVERCKPMKEHHLYTHQQLAHEQKTLYDKSNYRAITCKKVKTSLKILRQTVHLMWTFHIA